MKLVIYGTFPAKEADRIGKHLRGEWDVSVVFDGDSAERKRDVLAGAEVMVASVYREQDPPAPHLRLLQCSSTGVDRIDVGRLPAGCVLCNVHGHEIAIAEYVICTILDWAIGYRAMVASFRDGTWTLAEWLGQNHSEAYGKCLGIVGFGRIGRAAAARAKALGMEVRALSAWREGPPEAALVDLTFAPADWRAFLREVNFLLVCAPLTAETRGMVNRSWFDAMNHETVLIHVGRGAVIDEESLYSALRDRRIRGATLDVWYRYPPSSGARVAAANFPFHDLPNVVATPHKSGHTEETWERRFRDIARNLMAFAEGRPLANIIRGPGSI